MKILYIVTAGGKRNSGPKRFVEKTEAVILESVSSLMENRAMWDVDVYLILGYDKVPWQDEFQRKLQVIHPDIQLRVWKDALPLFYACDKWTNKALPFGD